MAEDTNIVANNNVYDYNYCAFKLPCGYCAKLCQPRPMQNHTGITWAITNGFECNLRETK